MTDEKLQQIASQLNYSQVDDLFAAVGFGDTAPMGVTNRLTDDIRAQREKDRQRKQEKDLLEDHQTISKDTTKNEKKKIAASSGVVIKGAVNLLVRLSHCCNPIPGDEIVGYITKGRGVSVHRAECPNVKYAEAQCERIIEVYWENKQNETDMYSADLEVQGYNRNGLLNDVLRSINNQTKNLSSVNGKIDHNRMVIISLTIGVYNLAHLNRIMSNLKNIKDVYVIKRPMH